MCAGHPIHPTKREPGEHPDLFQGDLAVTAHPAEVPDFVKALGQDVLCETIDELATRNRASLELL
jgi:hypothetical protein